MTLFDEPSRSPLPQPTFEDVTAAGRKSLLSIIPFVGAVGAELVGLLSTPLSQRRDSWLEDLARRLHELEGRVSGFHFEQLAANEQFVSATFQATHAAIRTHQEGKREALRNAILNIAVSKAPAGDLPLVFLHLVDTFTPTHVQVLSHFAGRDRSGADRFRRERDLTDQVVCDLRDRGLLRDTRPYAARGRDDAEALVHYGWEATNLGRQFLEFIAPPEASRS